MSRTIMLNPISGPPPPEALGGRLDSLQGARIGLFSNNKPNADVLLEQVGAGLERRFGVEIHRFTKEVPSLEADRDLIRRCGEACHAVVLAAYD
ncbi:MAG: hypothetical protein GY723_19635 [bacterium]|nr:hypothetical protein [bacterium]MCP5067726.1 hypothetical protein [bacterium]